MGGRERRDSLSFASPCHPSSPSQCPLPVAPTQTCSCIYLRNTRSCGRLPGAGGRLGTGVRCALTPALVETVLGQACVMNTGARGGEPFAFSPAEARICLQVRGVNTRTPGHRHTCVCSERCPPLHHRPSSRSVGTASGQHFPVALAGLGGGPSGAWPGTASLCPRQPLPPPLRRLHPGGAGVCGWRELPPPWRPLPGVPLSGRPRPLPAPALPQGPLRPPAAWALLSE